MGTGTGWGESESEGVTICLWSWEIRGALAARAETRLVPCHKFTGLGPEDAPARECFGREVPAEGMDFPSPLMYRVPQVMAMIAQHSESFRGPRKLRVGLREAHAEGAGRSRRVRTGWVGVREGMGSPHGRDPSCILCPHGCAGHPPGVKRRAGIPRRRLGAMNSFPFMICYDDTPEG